MQYIFASLNIFASSTQYYYHISEYFKVNKLEYKKEKKKEHEDVQRKNMKMFKDEMQTKMKILLLLLL